MQFDLMRNHIQFFLRILWEGEFLFLMVVYKSSSEFQGRCQNSSIFDREEKNYVFSLVGVNVLKRSYIMWIGLTYFKFLNFKVSILTYFTSLKILFIFKSLKILKLSEFTKFITHWPPTVLDTLAHVHTRDHYPPYIQYLQNRPFSHELYLMEAWWKMDILSRGKPTNKNDLSPSIFFTNFLLLSFYFQFPPNASVYVMNQTVNVQRWWDHIVRATQWN